VPKGALLTVYIANRLVQLVPVLFLVSIIVFSTMHILPGDPAELMLAGAEGGAISAERIAELRVLMGLDDPLHIQYLRFVGNALQGDLGTSIRFRSSVTTLVLERFPFTLRLALAGLVVAIVLGVTLGAAAAVWRNTWVDTFAMAFSFVGVSMPIFWLGLLLIFFFGMQLNWLPVSGTADWRALVLPGFTLGFVSAALISRLTRASLVEVMQEDYVRTARSKGLGEWRVLVGHMAKNALIPVVTVLGLQFGGMLAGAVVTEVVFSRPGLGRLIVNGILWKDYPLIQGAVLFTAVVYLGVNLVVDLTYAWLDPRIRYS
jgi:peptide/nickel transport system permease protein